MAATNGSGHGHGVPSIESGMAQLDMSRTRSRKPVPVTVQLSPDYTAEDESRMRDAPSSPVRIRQQSRELAASEVGIIEDGARPGMSARADSSIRHVEQEADVVSAASSELSTPQAPWAQGHSRTLSEPSGPLNQASAFDFQFDPSTQGRDRMTSVSPPMQPQQPTQMRQPSTILHRKPVDPRDSRLTVASSRSSDSQNASSAAREAAYAQIDARPPRTTSARPGSAYQLGTELHARGRSITPHDLRQSSLSPMQYQRNVSRSSTGSADRPTSNVDLVNVPYAQQMAQQTLSSSNALLRGAVGSNASLLDTRKTLEMYRLNVKKTNDLRIQYEFALFMLNFAREAAAEEARSGLGSRAGSSKKGDELESVSLTKEARQILQRLSDKGYGYAQYYLGDGYASGAFNNGKPDNDRAFTLFVAAGKHGHMEANYRAALCYEFGWGCRKDISKALQFFRQAASKGHPGAATRLGKACLTGDMGLGIKYRDGIRWLKRGTETADIYHNSAPYELGLMHINGYGDDIFKDEAYAAQLLTQAAELGHPLAALKMGEAYEHGLLSCPRDAALSLHFYNGAADKGLPEAMMALCAWYMVGADPVLPKDEAEAYEWAKRAAATGMPKAEYAVAYFTEMGIGCRRDPLEANVYYVRAADQGDERAKQRLAIIRAAESGDPQLATPATSLASKNLVRKKKSTAAPGDAGQPAKHDDKDCCVM